MIIAGDCPEVPEVLVKFTAKIISVFEVAVTWPRTWLASLMQKGRMEELVSLKASTKAGLGAELQDVFNGAEIQLQLQSKEGILSKAELGSKTEIKEAMIALTQLRSLQTPELLKCLPALGTSFNTAKENVSKCLLAIVADLKSLKKQCEPFHERFSKVMPCLDKWEFASVELLLDNSESPNGKEVEKTMAKAMEAQCFQRTSRLHPGNIEN